MKDKAKIIEKREELVFIDKMNIKRIELYKDIPLEAYKIIEEILSYIYTLEKLDDIE